MAPILSESSRRAPGQTLAALLANEEPLAIEVCLDYAAEIAGELRDLHASGRAHGRLDLAHVVIRGSGACLLPGGQRRFPDPFTDLYGFGEVFYAMLTGRTPMDGEFRTVPSKPSALNAPEAVRTAACRLAERCLSADRENAPDMQKILTETRLLRFMTKQFGPEPQPRRLSMATVYRPPLEMFAGKRRQDVHPAEDATVPEAEKAASPAPETRHEHEAQPRPFVKDLMCPKCRHQTVRLSRSRTVLEHCLNLLGFGVYRCHRCFYRYMPLLGRRNIRKDAD